MSDMETKPAIFRDALDFARANRLLFEVGPDEADTGLFVPLPDNTARRWRDERVGRVFAFAESGKDPRVQAAKRAGFNVQAVDLKRIRRNDFPFLRELSNRVHAELKEHPVAFYFAPGDTADVLSCAAVFLVALGTSPELAAPEGAIQYVFGRDELSREDLRVFQFKESIETGYSMPPMVRRHFNLNEHAAAESKSELAEESIIRSEEPPPTEVDHDLPVIDDFPPETVAPETVETPAQAQSPVADKHVPTTAPAAPATAVTTAAPPPAAKEIKLPPPSAASDADTGDAARFMASRFLTIRNKLLMIISTVILLALGVMIYLASGSHKDDTERRIKEFGLNTTNLIAQKIEGEFTNLTYTALNAGAGLLSRTNEAERALFTELFFQNNPNFAYLSVLRSEGETLRPVATVMNDRFAKESQLGPERFAAIVQTNANFFQAAVAGPVVRNVSPGLPVPLMALAASFGERGERFVVVSLIDPSRFQESFKTTGIIKTFMVDSGGILMAHPDSKLILSAENQSRVGIVKSLLQSKVGNGQIPYRNTDGEAHIGFFKKMTFAGLSIVSSVSEKEAFAEVVKMQNRNYMITMIVLFTSVLIVFFFSRTLSVPIVRLVNATQKVESGDYTFQIKPSTRDEIGSLTHSFQSMTGGLAERERLKDGMTRFVNKQVAEKAARGELALGGEEKDCAIFFSDLRGFTAMSEKMTPEQVVEYLNEYFTDMVGCVSETHGVVDKYIGDAIMATWGALDAVGNNTENAVNAALMMRERLIAFNERGKDIRPFAKFGCGINSGKVVSGQIGSSQKMEYTVIGDAVNLASRVETLNKPFGTDILISEDSYQRVADIFNVEKMPAISVKGKAEPQIIYAVLGRKDDPKCPRDMNEVRARTGGDPPKVDLANFSESKEDKFEILEG